MITEDCMHNGELRFKAGDVSCSVYQGHLVTFGGTVVLIELAELRSIIEKYEAMGY